MIGQGEVHSGRWGGQQCTGLASAAQQLDSGGRSQQHAPRPPYFPQSPEPRAHRTQNIEGERAEGRCAPLSPTEHKTQNRAQNRENPWFLPFLLPCNTSMSMLGALLLTPLTRYH